MNVEKNNKRSIRFYRLIAAATIALAALFAQSNRANIASAFVPEVTGEPACFLPSHSNGNVPSHVNPRGRFCPTPTFVPEITAEPTFFPTPTWVLPTATPAE